MFKFEVALETDHYMTEMDDLQNDITIIPYINVNQSATDLPKLLFANELISNGPITIQFDYWIGVDQYTHTKSFIHPPFTRKHLARVICSELKSVYIDQLPGWSFTYEMHLKSVNMKNGIYMVNYYNVVI